MLGFFMPHAPLVVKNLIVNDYNKTHALGM